MSNSDALKELVKGHRKRVKSIVADGRIDNLADYELVELLLFFAIPQKDTQPLARILLSKFGNISKLLEASFEQLIDIDGVGESTAVLLVTVFQIIKRYRISSLGNSKLCVSKRSVALNFLKPHLDMFSEEQFHLLCLDSAYNLIKHECVEKGTVNKVNFQIRKVCEIALKNKSSNVLIAHNHPSGIAEPSNNDDEATRELFIALKSLDIVLVDHIIVAKENFYSYKDYDRFREFVTSGYDTDFFDIEVAENNKNVFIYD